MAESKMDLESLIAAIKTPGVLPGSEDGPVEVIQTHISAVFLTGDRAYKLKKPVDFGFLDFSTAERRARFCREELRLNRRLAPKLYVGLAPVWIREGGQVEVGSPSANPPPSDEMLLVMERMPQERMMDALLGEGLVERRHVERLARLVAAFHRNAETGGDIDGFGTREAVGKLALENFDQTEDFRGAIFDETRHAAMRSRTARFLETRDELLGRRVTEGRIRDGHGDLHSPNVCFLGDEPVVYDCIEFSPAYRCGDVASDAGFMAMDLDFRGRPDLAEAFLQVWLEETEDDTAEAILPFYRAYRAMVRAKISALTASAPEVDDAVRTKMRDDAVRFFDLADHYTRGLTEPQLVVLAAPIGAPRDAIAAQLRWRLGTPVLDASALRATLGGSSAESQHAEGVTKATYQALAREARTRLERGESALVAGSFFTADQREPMREAAEASGKPICVVTLSLPEEAVGSTAGGGRGELPPAYLEALAAREEPSEFSREARLDVDVGRREAGDVVEEVLAWLGGGRV